MKSQEILSLIAQKKINLAEQELLSFKNESNFKNTIEKSYIEMILASHQTQYQKAYQIGEGLLNTNGGENPYVRFHQARNSIAVGEWKKGLRLFDSVRGHQIFGGPYLTHKKPLWDGQDVFGKTILIASEGGIGDAVCFSRFASYFQKKGARVILATYAPLFELFRSMQGVSAQVDRSVVDHCDFDFWIPALSSPRLLDLDYLEINGSAYIQCPEFYSKKWKNLVDGNRFKIGICWQGNPGFVEDDVRSIDGNLFLDILNLKQFDFYKVQIHSENNFVQHSNLNDLSVHVGGPLDLAGFIEQMDLFISVDSAMAHIAGAMGKKIILLNRVMGWFTFGYLPDHENLQTTPWYDSMNIIHQKKWGQWDEAILRLKDILLRDFSSL